MHRIQKPVNNVFGKRGLEVIRLKKLVKIFAGKNQRENEDENCITACTSELADIGLTKEIAQSDFFEKCRHVSLDLFLFQVIWYNSTQRGHPFFMVFSLFVKSIIP